MSNPRLESTREVAARLGVTTRTVARYVERGELVPVMRLPGMRGAFLFNTDDIDGLTEAQAS